MEFHLYRSKCVQDRFEFYDLAILRTSLRYNKQHGITGFLHRDEDNYFLYIEGTPAALHHLVARIKEDHRHKAFQTLMDGMTDTRRFESWSMGYSDHTALTGRLTVQDKPQTVLDFLQGAAARQNQQLLQMG